MQISATFIIIIIIILLQVMKLKQVIDITDIFSWSLCAVEPVERCSCVTLRLQSKDAVDTPEDVPFSISSFSLWTS